MARPTNELTLEEREQLFTEDMLTIKKEIEQPNITVSVKGYNLSFKDSEKKFNELFVMTNERLTFKHAKELLEDVYEHKNVKVYDVEKTLEDVQVPKNVLTLKGE